MIAAWVFPQDETTGKEEPDQEHGWIFFHCCKLLIMQVSC